MLTLMNAAANIASEIEAILTEEDHAYFDETFDTAKGRREWLRDIVTDRVGEICADADELDEALCQAVHAELTSRGFDGKLKARAKASAAAYEANPWS